MQTRLFSPRKNVQNIFLVISWNGLRSMTTVFVNGRHCSVSEQQALSLCNFLQRLAGPFTTMKHEFLALATGIAACSSFAALTFQMQIRCPVMDETLFL